MCEHRNWTVMGIDSVGYGSCLDCKKPIILSDLINGDHERSEAMLKKLEERYEILGVVLEKAGRLNLC